MQRVILKSWRTFPFQKKTVLLCESLYLPYSCIEVLANACALFDEGSGGQKSAVRAHDRSALVITLERPSGGLWKSELSALYIFAFASSSAGDQRLSFASRGCRPLFWCESFRWNTSPHGKASSWFLMVFSNKNNKQIATKVFANGRCFWKAQNPIMNVGLCAHINRCSCLLCFLVFVQMSQGTKVAGAPSGIVAQYVVVEVAEELQLLNVYECFFTFLLATTTLRSIAWLERMPCRQWTPHSLGPPQQLADVMGRARAKQNLVVRRAVPCDGGLHKRPHGERQEVCKASANLSYQHHGPFYFRGCSCGLLLGWGLNLR